MRVRQYFELYFKFIISAFGLEHSNPYREYRTLRINFDRLPHIDDAIFQFKHRLYDLNGTDILQNVNLHIPMDNVSEVNSQDHVVIQGMDVLLGGWNFLLNEKQVFPIGRKTFAKNHLNTCMQGRISNMNYQINNKGKNLWDSPFIQKLFGDT